MSPLRRQPLTIELALLGFLLDESRHGYEIHQQLSDPAGLGLVWRVKQSHLYALLGRLEQQGFITGHQEPQDNRPPRMVFHLTASGRETFNLWVSSPVPHGRELRQEFLAKLYFAERQGANRAKRLIDRQQSACRKWRAELMDRLREAEEPGRYERLVWQFRVGQIDAMLTWLDECAEQKTTLSRRERGRG
jgi:DNA-binding PadR family transcriptional regulator